MKNNILKFGLLAFLWMVYTLPAIAQPIEPPLDDDPIEPDPTPIDTWMIVLILISIVAGVYFLRKYNRKAMV